MLELRDPASEKGLGVIPAEASSEREPPHPRVGEHSGKVVKVVKVVGAPRPQSEAVGVQIGHSLILLDQAMVGHLTALSAISD